MFKIAFINGSPRATNSLSTSIIDYFIRSLNQQDTSIFNAYKLLTTDDLSSSFKEILSCESIVVVTPLYVDALPSHLISFLQKLELYQKTHPLRHTPVLYGFINCGFIEGSQNHIALSMLENYAHHMGWQFNGGIGLGGGEMFKGSKDSIPKASKILQPIYEALDTFILTLSSSVPLPQKEMLVNPNFPKAAFILMGNLSWMPSARKHGLNVYKLFHKPYLNKGCK